MYENFPILLISLFLLPKINSWFIAKVSNCCALTNKKELFLCAQNVLLFQI
jgi:hypothetical protein